MRPLRPLAAIFVCAAAIAGCGGSSEHTVSTSQGTPAASKPATDGRLTVGGTTINLGDATTGTAQGIQVLPDTKVPPSDQYREGVGAGADCQNVNIMPSQDNMDQVIAATLCLLNGQRADHGLKPLREDDDLAQAAKNHTRDMIKGQYFDHVDPNGATPVDRIRRAGYIPAVGTWIVGENLAWGTGTLATPKSIVKAWMNSEGHRENILRSSFNQIGFGVAVGNPSSNDGQGATYTTTFGGKSGGAPSAAPKAKGKLKARKARIAKLKAKKHKGKIKARIALGTR